MKREEISKAISGLEECYLLEALELTLPDKTQAAPEEVTMKHTKQAVRTARRSLLIAALISVFFAVTAFAIGYSVHQQRQQELRDRMQIDEHNVTSYVEYPVPTEEEGAEPGEMKVTLLSSSLNNEFAQVYFNVSPIDEAVFEQQDGFAIDCSIGDGWRGSQLIPKTSGYTWSSETDSLNLDDFLYDRESKTVTMVCSFPLRSLETGKSIELTVRQWPDEKEIGSFSFEVPELEIRTCMFPDPLVFTNEELENSGGRILGVELSSTGMTWLLEHDDAERFYYGSAGIRFEELPEAEQEWVRQVNGPWARTIARVTQGTLHMKDGSDFELPSAEGGAYENGIVKRYSDFYMQTIDINAVTAITIDGTRIELG